MKLASSTSLTQPVWCRRICPIVAKPSLAQLFYGSIPKRGERLNIIEHEFKNSNEMPLNSPRGQQKKEGSFYTWISFPFLNTFIELET